MISEFHPANERGFADHGWLRTHFSFSFAMYYNRSRVKFGCLRVLNDDWISGGSGFDLHPHSDMEITTLILEGSLEHRDNMGHTQVIGKGDIQVLSAGTGVYHAEYNHSGSDDLRFLQIWIFPREKALPPRYDHRSYFPLWENGKLITLVTPDNAQEAKCLSIKQDAWISSLKLSRNENFTYKNHLSKNGIFVMLLDGIAEINSIRMKPRDAMAISETRSFQVSSVDDCRFLFIEVPMIEKQ